MPTPTDVPRPRTRPPIVVDLYAGAGGLSTGAERAFSRLGRRVKLVAVNHWPVAIATHQKNHPDADHYGADVAALRPHIAVPGGRADLLVAGPACTFYSRARGGKPTSDQQRSAPWDILTWLTELRVQCLLVENVPEIRFWGPVNPATGRPLKSRSGEYFRQWVAAIRGVGFQVDWRILCAADYGDATTRERFFLIGRSDGKPLRWPEPTHARAPQAPDLFGHTRARWRPAAEIIDWSIRGTSIFTRTPSLRPNTLRRIYAGLVKFRWPEPFLVILRHHMAAQGIGLPLPTVTASGTHIGLVQPFVFANRTHNTPKASAADPVPSACTSGGIALVEPFVLNRHGDRARSGTRAHSLDRPLPTVTGSGGGYLLEPFVLSQASGGAPRSASEPIPGPTCDGAHALVAPYYGNGSGRTCRSVGDPLPACTTKARFELVMPVTHRGGHGRARAATAPLPTITGAHRGELALIEPARGCDILFRMLQPHELAAAMGFTRYEFCGTKTDRYKQIGNAVPINLATALIDALISV